MEGLWSQPADPQPARPAEPLPPVPAAQAPGRTNAADRPTTVSELAGQIGRGLERAFPGPVRVLGEVSNFSSRTHWYFAIKDAGAVLNCVMFAGRARGHAFVPSNGQSVVVTARVEFYEPQGRLTLMADRIEPVGLGALEEAFRRLMAELRGLGWFDDERKRPLPRFPRRIAVITSKKGAALQDVLNTIRRRCPAVEVCLIDCLVQGPAAAPDVARAVGWVSRNARVEGIDALLVTRGGGSLEDLWAFNERSVAEAILACSVPVVAAIGHETDTTIAELVADARASTPTQAAMLLTPDRAALAQELFQHSRRIALAARRFVQSGHERMAHARLRLSTGARQGCAARGAGLSRLAARLERASPAALLARRAAVVLEMRRRIAASMAGSVSAARVWIDSSHRQLALVGPDGVLRRGYSLTTSVDGRIVRSPADVKVGDPLITRLAEGRIESVVGTSLPLAPLAAAPVKPAPRRPRRGGVTEPGTGLFDTLPDNGR